MCEADIRVRELLGVNAELDGGSLPRVELHVLKAQKLRHRAGNACLLIPDVQLHHVIAPPGRPC